VEVFNRKDTLTSALGARTQIHKSVLHHLLYPDNWSSSSEKYGVAEISPVVAR
jgi:hypothetical protein